MLEEIMRKLRDIKWEGEFPQDYVLTGPRSFGLTPKNLSVFKNKICFTHGEWELGIFLSDGSKITGEIRFRKRWVTSFTEVSYDGLAEPDISAIINGIITSAITKRKQDRASFLRKAADSL